MLSRKKKLPYVTGIILIIVFTMISSSASPEETETQSEGSSSTYPIDLSDLGYDGTWDQFCNQSEIDKLYPDFPEHDLVNIRIKICSWRDSRHKFVEDDLRMLAAYKYCIVMKPDFDDLLIELTNKLSLEDRGKRAFLVNLLIEVNQTACYNKTIEAFYRTCVAEFNPCIRMPKLIIARACEVSWLTTENILDYIVEVCAGKWISDNVDWPAILRSIKFNP